MKENLETQVIYIYSPRVVASQYYFREDIETVFLSKEVEIIEDWAFGYCTNLKYIFISSGVRKISQNAFDGCDKLEVIEVSDQNNSFCSKKGVLYDKQRKIILRCPSNAEIEEFIIPSSIEQVGENAFNRCRRIRRIHFSKGLKTIGKKAFAYCSNLTEIKLFKNIDYIGETAFADCCSLVNLEIEDNDIYFTRDCCLYERKNGMVKLFQYPVGRIETEYQIDKNVNEIADRAFTSSNLQTLYINQNNDRYITKQGVLFDKLNKRLCYYPNQRKAMEYYVPEDISVIGNSSMKQNDNIKTVHFPRNLVLIERHSVEDCTRLKEVVFHGERLATIEWSAFSGCVLLRRIDLMNQKELKFIDSLAFMDCASLQEVYFPKYNFRVGKGLFRGTKSDNYHFV